MDPQGVEPREPSGESKEPRPLDDIEHPPHALEDLMRFLLANPKQHRYEARRAQWNNFKMR